MFFHIAAKTRLTIQLLTTGHTTFAQHLEEDYLLGTASSHKDDTCGKRTTASCILSIESDWVEIWPIGVKEGVGDVLLLQLLRELNHGVVVEDWTYHYCTGIVREKLTAS